MYIVHTDGGARGNPGPAAIGVIIERNNKVITSFGKYLGNTTNNVAEYRALIESFHYLLNENNHDKDEVACYLDSELVVKQLRGEYKIKNQSLYELASSVKSLVKEWGRPVMFCHIPREKNTAADMLVNRVLDSHQ